jgi:phosphoglycerate kinase
MLRPATLRTLAGSVLPTVRNFHASAITQAAKLGVEGMAQQANLKGENVLLRADLNVPLAKDGSGKITDDTRLKGAVPTIQFLLDQGAKVVLCSHFGRPKGKVNEDMRLTPVANRLSELLGIPVEKCDDCIGPDVEAAVSSMADGSIILLENTRFYAEEEGKGCSDEDKKTFDEKLSKLASYYVNDAFGAAHRSHASTARVAPYMKMAAAGYLMEKEIKYLISAVEEPERPMAAVIGGAKVSTKLPVLESLMDKAEVLVVGGGMIFTFYRAMGHSVGDSLVEEEQIELAKSMMSLAESKGVKLMLPTDVVVADKFDADAESKVVPIDAIPDGWLGLDIGPDSISAFKEELSGCKTVVWNGPMGVFEFDKFATGTMAIAECMAELTPQGVTTIVGGGDSVAAVNKAGLGAKLSHISTGGGASLELLEGKVLPGLDALNDA